VPGVFISYRREDSAGWAGRIYDRLAAQFGTDQVFLDVEAIAPGEDFTTAVAEVLQQVDVVIAVVGPKWLDATGVDGRHRLEDPSDYVRREIAGTLKWGTAIVPILVDGARMPAARDLPQEIKAFAARNAVAVSSERFDYDMSRVLEAVRHPAARSGETAAHNLPLSSSSFIGRREELAEVARLVGEHRIVTLTGAGGSGKSRLALQFAGGVLDRYPSGVWFVDFTAIEDPNLAPAQLAAATGVSDVPGQDVTAGLVKRLGRRETLLVFDNCEHVLEGAASLATALLERASKTRVLATSREPLRITGEHIYLIPTLSLPPATESDPVVASEYAAVQLFRERAEAVTMGFTLTASNTAAVTQICRRLDGLPLALELAAARLNVLNTEGLRRRLDHDLSVLGRGARDTAPRHQTLVATLDWSYGLLSSEEKAVLNRASVFRGGFTIEAAETVCSGDGVDPEQMLDLVSSLVDKSLLVPYDGAASRRFDLLGTIRHYAAGRLADAGEDGRTQERHAAYFRDLAAAGYDQLWGEDEVAWLDRLEDERPNCEHALTWHLETHHTQEGLMMAGSLYRVAYRRQRTKSLINWLERFLAADNTPSAARARAMLGRATLLVVDSMDEWTEAIALCREFSTDDDLLSALNNAAVSAMRIGDWEAVKEIAGELNATKQSDPATRAFHVGLASAVALELDRDPRRALALAVEELRLARLSNSPELLVEELLWNSMLRRRNDDLDGAEALLREADDVLETELGGRQAYPGSIELHHAALALDRRRIEEARRYLEQHAAMLQPMIDEDEGIRTQLALWIVGHYGRGLFEWARLATAENRLEQAVSLLATLQVLAESKVARLHPSDQAEVDALLSHLRNRVDTAAWNTAWDAGRNMSLTQAIDAAIGVS
jgi:non-specific serine/threonine protein kinase